MLECIQVILFGDHKVTPASMASLGIQETCLLRGDYYHNMSEVFPKKFGEHFFAIKVYLKAMLESKTEEEWSSAYHLWSGKTASLFPT